MVRRRLAVIAGRGLCRTHMVGTGAGAALVHILAIVSVSVPGANGRRRRVGDILDSCVQRAPSVTGVIGLVSGRRSAIARRAERRRGCVMMRVGQASRRRRNGVAVSFALQHVASHGCRRARLGR